MIGDARIAIAISGDVAFAMVSMSSLKGLISGKSDVNPGSSVYLFLFSAGRLRAR
jgi:hypothetical protein